MSNVDYTQEAAILQCPSCMDVIQSKHRWDYVECDCGEVFTDGGNEYPRAGWTNSMPITLKEFGVTNVR